MMTNQIPTAYRQGKHIILPGLASAHSHTFQRALRGRTQRRKTGAGSFWSWRELMYALAEKLNPDDVFHIARFAFVELAMSGVTAIGEFHYVHHGPNGKPYADRTTLADAVVQAAREVGLRITLIRTAYLRAGFEQEMNSAQRRFADPSVDFILQDVETLGKRYADDPTVTVGLAAHSIRTVPRPDIVVLARYARQQNLPFHMHIAEQWNEVRQSLSEHGLRPIELLVKAEALWRNFVAVHATHISPGEIEALGRADAFVCLCRTTERDLGDGLPQVDALVQAGVRLCVGVDSHASGDAFEEIRAVEWDDRTRTEARHVAAEAPDLLQMATQIGYNAIGLGEMWQEDEVRLRGDDPSMAGINDDLLTDAVIFGATPRAVDEVIVAGQRIIEGGVHPCYEEALRNYEATLKRLEML